MYERVSQSHQDLEPPEDAYLTPTPRRKSSQAPRSELEAVDEGQEFGDQRALMNTYEYDDAPPPSIIHTYRSKHSRHSMDIPRTSQTPDLHSTSSNEVHPRQVAAPTPDSMFDRVFPSDAGHSSTTASSAIPSS